MSTSSSISQIMLNKLEQRQDYIAWYLVQHKRNENLTDEQIADFLETSIFNVNRLAMCKVPDAKSSVFLERTKELGKLTDTNSSKLIAIIRKVNSITALQNSKSSIDASLLAARENENKSNER